MSAYTINKYEYMDFSKCEKSALEIIESTHILIEDNIMQVIAGSSLLYLLVNA